jgi:hypothetical protein
MLGESARTFIGKSARVDFEPDWLTTTAALR